MRLWRHLEEECSLARSLSLISSKIMTLFRSVSTLFLESVETNPQEDLDTEVADTVKPISDEEVLRRLEEKQER